MPTLQKHARENHPGLTWTAVSGIQPVVYVGRLADRALAIVELRPGRTFRETLTTGELLGEFDSLEESQAALDDWLVAHPA